MTYDIARLVKRTLLDEFPGMRFDIQLTNPRSKYRNDYRTVEITYNEEAAAERGITQTSMREALKPVTTQDTIVVGTKTYYVADLTKVTFKKKQYTRQNVNPERVAQAVTALRAAHESDASPTQMTQQVVEIMKAYVPRSQHDFFDAVISELGE